MFNRSHVNIGRASTPRSLFYCLFAPHICMVLFFTHIPFVVNHTINATPPERLQQHPLLSATNRTDRTFFVWRLTLARPSHPGHSTILLTCSFCWGNIYRPLTQTATWSFTTIQQHAYRRKQLMDQADNSLTALLTKRDQVRFREIVNTCTERRTEKRIQQTVWILSHVLRKTLCEHVNGLCPAGWAVYYKVLVPVRTYLSI